MKFMLDENVPAAVAEFLVSDGHEVMFSRDAVGEGEPDPVVALAAQVNEAILISHDRDMSRIQRQLSAGNAARFPKLDLIMLSCPEPKSSQRLQKFLPVIRAEIERLTATEWEERLKIDVGERKLSILH
ncbi:MAG: DUF5615 family PIN-like protein [Sphingopyxis sp.]|nr:DUF5615 family PIN-like protein [Sphingopyxis sp.]